MIRIPEFVKNLKAYKAGKPISELAREKKLDRIIKLTSAENPIGPSPKAIEAIQGVLGNLNRYPDPSGYDLVQAIARKYDVHPNHVICAHGADAILAYIVNAFTQENDEIITSQATFIGISVAARKSGRRLVQVPHKNYAYDLEAILNTISPRTTMIYLANPNNPTGSMFGKEVFEDFMNRVPKHIMVILDEAYTAYATGNPDYPNGVRYEYENMVVTRTFSKAYGLAGLRIGFAVGPDQVIEALYKVKLPFEPNNLAQVGAIAALDDDEFLEQSIALNKQSLEILYKCFTANEIEHLTSHTNFILTLMPTEEFAQHFTQECMNKGLILRHVDTFGVPNGVRINSGTIEETEMAAKIIGEVYQVLLEEHKTAAT